MPSLLYSKKMRKTKVYLPPVTTIQSTGTFDGAAQLGICGGGGTITLQDGRIFHYMVGLGNGTNNRAELLSLWTLLWIAKRLECTKLQVYGDSLAIIDWVNQKASIRNTALTHWYLKTVDLKKTFTCITIQHHHREHNQMADTLSKQGLQLGEGIIMIKEVSEADSGDWETLQIY